MMDIWLIFILFIPFFEVLLHTFIDSLRDEEVRDFFNHHGSAIPIGKNEIINVKEAEKIKRRNRTSVTALDSIHRNEDVEVKSRKEYYSEIRSEESLKRQRKRKIVEKLAIWGVPIVFFTFVTVYFALGANYYYRN